jgi:ABC-type nitrate/sulfonate/bicarbonate transport system permease component
MRTAGRAIWGLVPAAILLLLFLAAWQAYVEIWDVNAVILPSPTDVATALWDHRASLLADLGVTMQEIVYGFILGAVVGMVLGVMIVYSRALERALYPLVITSQAVPVFAIAPLLVIWFGFGITPKILMAAVIVFFPICVNQVQGLRSADRGAIELMSAYGAKEWRIFRSVRLPASIPYLLAGMQLGVTYAVIGAVIAEWLGADKGIGYRMVQANSLAETDIVFAAIVVVALVGVALFAVVRVLGNVLFPWQAHKREES